MVGSVWRDLFAYRFAPGESGGGVGGHSLGNLILRALEDLNAGDLREALGDAEQMLNTVGHVVPVSLEHTTLCAELTDGQVVRGEDHIDQPAPGPIAPIARIFLEPTPMVTVQARKALERSARIILGPGDSRKRARVGDAGNDWELRDRGTLHPARCREDCNDTLAGVGETGELRQIETISQSTQGRKSAALYQSGVHPRLTSRRAQSVISVRVAAFAPCISPFANRSQ